LDLKDEVLHVEGLGATLQVRPDPVLVSGVGVHDVPLARQQPQLSLEGRDRVRILSFGLLSSVASAGSFLSAVSFASASSLGLGLRTILQRAGIASRAVRGGS